jgi:hypothetical protein
MPCPGFVQVCEVETVHLILGDQPNDRSRAGVGPEHAIQETAGMADREKNWDS